LLFIRDASSSMTEENKLHIGLIAGLVSVCTSADVSYTEAIWGKISVI